MTKKPLDKQKQKISVKLITDIELGALDAMSENIKKWNKEYSGIYSDLRFDLEKYYYPYDESEYTRINLVGYRMEYDEEIENRLRLRKEVEEAQKLQELKQLEALKAKYETQ